ncbi:hypothetical protein ABFA07_014458 [Porites harrisoni]
MLPIGLFLCFAVLTVHTTTSSPTVCPQKTTSGKCCSIPFTYRGVTYNSCTSVNHNRPWCSLDPVYKGRWGNCPLPVTTTLPTVCPQKTTSGKCCSIPFEYRGVNYSSCTSANHNRPWCSLDPVYKGRWGNCPAVTTTLPTVCPQKTTSGKCCSIPFEYSGVTYSSCTSANHNRPWCSLDPVYKGRWGNCPAVTTTLPTVCPQKTTSGKCCSIPFEYRGVNYSSCTSANHHRPWCSLDSVYKGRWGNCPAVTTTLPTVCPQKTTSGKCCSIPFEYSGMTYSSCTSANHNRPWCSLDPVYKGRWGNYPAVTTTLPTVCPQKTTSGKCCSIPFEYSGVTYSSCTSANHNRPWCSLDPVYKGRWGNCPAETTTLPTVCPQKTTSGKCCSIPFEYSGVTYSSCTSANHNRPWCSLDPVYKGRWGNCRG